MSSDSPNMKRRWFLTAATAGLGAVGAGFAVVPFVSSMAPSAKTKAIGGPVKIDISKLEAGQMMISKWRGKPVWIVSRTKETLGLLDGMAPKLADPDSEREQQPDYAKNTYRSIKPDYLVVVGICTHLGCSPKYVKADEGASIDADWAGGFFCPCHGSKFDLAGRVYKSVPAPTNLVVPPHQYLSDTRLIVGVDSETS